MINLPNFFKIALAAVVLTLSCGQPNQGKIEADAVPEKIQLISKGELVVLMSNNITSYYVLNGQPRGYEYEMLKYFCEDNGLVLQLKVMREWEFMLDSLNAGKGDLAAGNITVTKARKELVDFSPEILRTRQVLVQRLPEGYKKLTKKQRQARMVGDALELAGKKVHVNAGSSYYDRLVNFKEENGIDVDIVPVGGEIGTDALIRLLANGDIDYTVLDENVARIHAGVYANIDISVPMSLSQSIAWALPKGHPELADLIATWIDQNKGSSRYNAIHRKYFGSTAQLQIKDNYLSIVSGKISPYDNLIKKHADYIGWDWLLLAAMINKESKFNPNIESPFGAVGLMQLLPATAERFGVMPTELTNPDLNIMAGSRFIQYLDNFWYKRIADSTQVKYFVLASYNAGPGHVLDAMRLAEKHGLDPNLWFDNVALMMLKKSEPSYYRDPVVKSGYCNGAQVVVYVTKVLDYYQKYQEFIVGISTPNTNLAVIM